jgi:hypothetical protein
MSIYAHTIYNLGAKQLVLERGDAAVSSATRAKEEVGHVDFVHVQDATPVFRGGTNSSSRLHLRRRPAVTRHPTATVSP